MKRISCTALVPLLLLVATGCAYPRRSAPVTPVAEAAAPSSGPDDVWQIEFLEAVIPPRQRSGLPWDEDGSGPDAFVRVYRGDELVWESEPVPDSLNPELGALAPDNVFLPTNEEIRLELWDDDDVLADPIGTWRGRGLPRSALPGANARLLLEGRATLVFRVETPVAQRGIGIALYEMRGSYLKVVEVIRHSPAGRAGIQAGDSITAIGDSTVEQLGGQGAAGAISRAGRERTSVTIEREGHSQQLELDGGFIWTTL